MLDPLQESNFSVTKTDGNKIAGVDSLELGKIGISLGAGRVHDFLAEHIDTHFPVDDAGIDLTQKIPFLVIDFDAAVAAYARIRTP